jgi:dynein heavy chain, axonemal
VKESKIIPWKALQYLTGECNYGGRVTDTSDRRALMTLLSLSFSPEILEDGYSLSESGRYMIPTQGDHSLYLKHITNLPATQTPEAFGLHENADISKEIATANLIMDTLLSTQSTAPPTTSGKSSETLLGEVLETMLAKVPADFDMDLVLDRYPICYGESMNTVLMQEVVRFTRLLTVIRGSLKQAGSALRGLTVMSREIEEVCKSVGMNRVPELWLSRSYPSLKPLVSL